MSDETQGEGQSQNLPATVQRVREIRVVHSDLPMYDTASFEHLGRVAAIMAQAELLPRTLTHVTEGSGNNRQEIALPMEVVKARALLIANQARLWDMDPLAVAQCTSLVHNRLMYEGKLVHAVVEAKTGIRLRYEFGLWDTDHFVPAEGDALNGAGERLAVRVIGRFDDEDEDRTVEGSVGAWKTTGTNSPWGSPGSWRRQLRYRGAREWARAHNPGPILGIITDDEDHEMMTSEPTPRQVRVKRDLKARLAAPVEPPQAEEPADTATSENGDVVDQTTGEVVEEGGPQDDASAPIAEDASTSKASAEDASTTSDKATPGESAPEVEAELENDAPTAEWWELTEISEGFPVPGERYRLAGDVGGDDGKVPTYADGEPFSRAGVQGSQSLKVYRAHAPKTESAEEEGDAQTDTEAHEEASTTSDEDGGGFLGDVRKLDSWLTIKPRWIQNAKTEEWLEADPEDKDIVKAMVRSHVEKIGDPVDPAQDPVYFVIWIGAEDTIEGADLIEATLASLEKSPGFAKLKDDAKARVRAQAETKVAALRGEE